MLERYCFEFKGGCLYQTLVWTSILSDNFQMENATPTAVELPSTAFRLWYEFLRLAHSSRDANVKRALTGSSKHYRHWHMKRGEPFDRWWAQHKDQFAERLIVRTLSPGESPRDPNALVIEVPLNASATELTKSVGKLIRAALPAAQPGSKSKRTATARYHLTGAEPRLHVIGDMLTVHRDVHLPSPNLRGKKLLDAVHRYYEAKGAQVPAPLALDRDGDKVRAMRNVRRYLQNAEQILLNVAHGEFPGRYGSGSSRG